MSFLVDPPLLFASGAAYARAAPEEAQGGIARAAGAACLATFWGVGAWLYLAGPASRGFMVNFPLLRVDARRRSAHMDAAAAGIFAAVYPLALWLGWDRGRRARPRGG